MCRRDGDDNRISGGNFDFVDLSRRIESVLLVTFVTTDKSNPRAGSAADKAELIYMEQEVDYMDVVQPENR